MNYTLKLPSLEHIALVKTATTLWNQDDIRALMSKFNYTHFIERREIEWQEIEKRVTEKVPQLSLPQSLKEETLGFINAVGLQIFKWKKYHENNCLYIGLPNELCWTPHGTVDIKKTAKALIKDESLGVTSRYKLACNYCLEDDVQELWNKIPENPTYSKIDPLMFRQHYLVVHWAYHIKGELKKLDDRRFVRFWRRQNRMIGSHFQYAFYHAAVCVNSVATEYFLQKLSSREREWLLVGTAKDVAYNWSNPSYSKADVLCSLLSQMDGEQQIEVFKSDPLGVLKCLLNWPWQSLFMETANRMWDFLDKNHYYLLYEIVHKVMEGYKDYDYQKLFGEFWQQSPNDHKRYVIHKWESDFLISKLFKIKGIENVKLILKDATLIDKRKLIFSNRGKDICGDLIRDDEWDSLEFFIRECISSKDEMIRFKEEFEKHSPWLYSKVEFAEKKDKFFQLLDDFMNGYNKRKSVVEGDSGPAKRLHSTE